MRIRYDQPGARFCRVLDADTGEQINGVIEADDGEGWYIAHVYVDGRPALAPDGESFLTERVERRIRIKVSERAAELMAAA